MHELGHAIAAWLLGYPAIPTPLALTFIYPRSSLLTFFLGIIFVYYSVRHITKRKAIAINRYFFLWLFYVCCLYSSYLSSLVISFMGQGGEVVAAFIFTYLGLSAHVDKSRQTKKLFTFLGVFLFLSNILFSVNLMFSNEFIAMYQNDTTSFLGEKLNDFLVLDRDTVLSFKMFAFLLLLLNFLGIYYLFKVLPLPYNIFTQYKRNLIRLLSGKA